MRGYRTMLGAAAAAIMLVPCGGGVGSAGAADDPMPALNAREHVPASQEPLSTDMRSAALAYARYGVLATAATRARRHGAAARHRRAAGIELRRFAGAAKRLGGSGGDGDRAGLGVLAGAADSGRTARQGEIESNVADLRAAIAGESQDLVDYARWAGEAAEDGCPAAAGLFSEVRRDESGHLARFATAVQALVDPGSGTTVPEAPQVTPVDVRAGRPTCSARTVGNLRSAMTGEAVAAAKYTLFGDYARATGHGDLAALFAATADVELLEHFTMEANLAGLVRGDTPSGVHTPRGR